jgi:hypothetical protein
VLRKICGPRKVTGDWRKPHNEELHYPYCSPNIIRVIKSRSERSWACETYGGEGEVHIGVWWGNLKRSFGRPMRKWENNIQLNIKEISWKGRVLD